RWWRIMLSADAVFTDFRSKFIGKSSPSHFFWGAFDLAVTRFNGKRAQARPPGPLAKIMAEAYSHEVISAGFWPGGQGVEEPAFYAYAAPAPDGFAQAKVKPAAAWYDTNLGDFFLKYEDVRRSARPREMLMDFLESTYAAAAD